MIQFKNVFRKYFLGDEEWDFGPLNFSVEKHKSVCILGPSGSGKSTLLHLFGLLDSPSSGEIFFKGEKISDLSESKKNEFRKNFLGFIFQDFYLFPELTAEENIQISLDLEEKYSKNKKQEKVKKILKKIGLEEKKNHLPSQLSGGQRQRVAIARAIVKHPQILLADEPTGNLDQKTGKKILDLLFEVAKENNMGFWCVTHDENIASRFDMQIQIQDGKILQIA